MVGTVLTIPTVLVGIGVSRFEPHTMLSTVAAALVVVVLVALPVLWTRSAPLAAVVVLATVSGLGFVVNESLILAGVVARPNGLVMLSALAFTALGAAVPATYGVARRRAAPVLVVSLAIVAVPTTSMALFYSERGGTWREDLVITGLTLFLAYVAVLAPGWGVGLRRRRRARWAAERVRRNAESAGRAIRHERAQVMRELQALVLADLASIEQQAERAHRVLGAAPVDPAARADARAALVLLTASGRDTLTAMRRLLGMLRGSGEDLVRAPQPTLDRLDELVEAHRRAGLDVRLTVSGERRALPDDVDLAAYRLLQRVLEGSRGAGPVRLQVAYADRALGLVARGDLGDSGGVAVREWVRFAGGEVVVGSGSSGFEVRLPTRRGSAA